MREEKLIKARLKEEGKMRKVETENEIIIEKIEKNEDRMAEKKGE